MEFRRPDSAISQSTGVFGGPGGVLSEGMAPPDQWQPATPARRMRIRPARPVHKALSARQLVNSPAPCRGMTRASQRQEHTSSHHNCLDDSASSRPAAAQADTQNSSRHMMTKDPSINSNRDRNA
jgi:hypothetical protein